MADQQSNLATQLPWNRLEDIMLGQNELFCAYTLNRNLRRLLQNDQTISALIMNPDTGFINLSAGGFVSAILSSVANTDLDNLDSSAWTNVLDPLSAAMDAKKVDVALSGATVTAVSSAYGSGASVYNPVSSNAAAAAFLSAHGENTMNASLTGYRIGSPDITAEFWAAADGTGWYRRYKSGFIEQGGVISFDRFASTPYRALVKFFYLPFSAFYTMELGNCTAGATTHNATGQHLVDHDDMTVFYDDPGTYEYPKTSYLDRALVFGYFNNVDGGNNYAVAWHAFGW